MIYWKNSVGDGGVVRIAKRLRENPFAYHHSYRYVNDDPRIVSYSFSIFEFAKVRSSQDPKSTYLWVGDTFIWIGKDSSQSFVVYQEEK